MLVADVLSFHLYTGAAVLVNSLLVTTIKQNTVLFLLLETRLDRIIVWLFRSMKMILTVDDDMEIEGIQNLVNYNDESVER